MRPTGTTGATPDLAVLALGATVGGATGGDARKGVTRSTGVAGGTEARPAETVESGDEAGVAGDVESVVAVSADNDASPVAARAPLFTPTRERIAVAPAIPTAAITARTSVAAAPRASS